VFAGGGPNYARIGFGVAQAITGGVPRGGGGQGRGWRARIAAELRPWCTEHNCAAINPPTVAELAGKEPPGMQVVRQPVAVVTLTQMAERMFGNLVKAVVDLDLGVMAIDGEMHADEEARLLDEGSRQASLWGINLYPGQFGTPDFVEFDSVINIRPSQGNRTRLVDDAATRAQVTSVVDRLVTA
jgi:hypothetical protein